MCNQLRDWQAPQFLTEFADVIDLINSKAGIKTGSQNSEGKALGGRAPELSCERDLERDPSVTTIPCQNFVALAVSIIQAKSNLCLNWRFTPTPQMRIYKRIWWSLIGTRPNHDLSSRHLPETSRFSLPWPTPGIGWCLLVDLCKVFFLRASYAVVHQAFRLYFLPVATSTTC